MNNLVEIKWMLRVEIKHMDGSIEDKLISTHSTRQEARAAKKEYEAKNSENLKYRVVKI